MMLRNMVSSLLEHEQITTTVAKAKEAQKLAEQVIGWGKKGDKAAWDRANSYLLVSSRSFKPLVGTPSFATAPGARSPQALGSHTEYRSANANHLYPAEP